MTCGGVSGSPELPPTLHQTTQSAGPSWSQTLKGLLSPLCHRRPFPSLLFRQDVARDSRNLVGSIHARLYLTDEVFRYLKMVIVTTAV